MTAYLLFYHELSRHENQFAFIDRIASHFHIVPIVIDTLGTWKKSDQKIASLQEALDDPRFIKAEWVWLDASGETYLDEYEHPKDDKDVIYCVGSDKAGFQNNPMIELLGTKVKIRQYEDQEGEWFAAIVVPLVVYDRFLYLQGRRY